MRKFTALIGLAIGVLITLPAAWLAMASAGGGHGHYEFARLHFPYSMLLTRWTDDTITLPLIVLALGQFPLYGLLIGMSARTGWAALIVVLVLLIAHAVAAVFCFSGAIPNFS